MIDEGQVLGGDFGPRLAREENELSIHSRRMKSRNQLRDHTATVGQRHGTTIRRLHRFLRIQAQS